MKATLKSMLLPLMTLLFGIAGFLLRFWLFRTGIDHKGLVIASHPACSLSFILLAVYLGLLLLKIRLLGAVDHYRDQFPASFVPAVGCIAAAAGILICQLRTPAVDLLGYVLLVMALIAAGCLIALAICRIRGKRPFFLFHVGVTVYLMLHLFTQFRIWGSEPELQQIFFPLLAGIFLMLTGYYSSVLDAKKAGRRWFVFANQAAVVCCCMSLTTDNWLFYLTLALWCFLGLCKLHTDTPIEKENT